MATPESGGKTAPTAVRMRQLRRASGYADNAKGFAEKLGITPPRLSNFENGLPISIDVAKRICQQVPGMSLDWLYYGKLEAVPLALQRRLEAADEAVGKAKTRSPSKAR